MVPARRGYTPAVPVERIALSLAFINWTVLTGLAVGAFAAIVLGRLRTDATRGFLTFTGTCAVLFGLLALLSDGALPSSLSGSPITADASWTDPRRAALALFCGLAAAYVIAIARGRRAALGLALSLHLEHERRLLPKRDGGRRRQLRNALSRPGRTSPTA